MPDTPQHHLFSDTHNRPWIWYIILNASRIMHQTSLFIHPFTYIIQNTSYITYYISYITHNILHIIYYTSYIIITYYISYITHHILHIIHYTSNITHHISHITYCTSYIIHCILSFIYTSQETSQKDLVLIEHIWMLIRSITRLIPDHEWLTLETQPTRWSPILVQTCM